MKKIFIIVFSFMTISSVAQNGNSDTAKQITNNNITREASFPGGETAWNAYLKKILEKEY